MICFTAGTGEYEKIIRKQQDRCKEFGYQHRAFDLGGLGFGDLFHVSDSDLKPSYNGDSLPPATFKTGLMRKVMHDDCAEGETCCWLDADCIPLKPFEPVDARFWDAAVTLRPAGEIGQSNHQALDYLNSGVVWIRKTPHGRMFAEAWDIHTRELNTDQGGLNWAVAPKWRMRDWVQSFGQIVESPSGARVLVLDATDWNRWHLPPTDDTKILHFKRGIRGQAANYL